MSQIRSNILIISKDNTNLSSALRAINSDGTTILDVNNDGTTQFGTGFKISSGGNSASVTGLFPIFDGFGGSFEAALIGLTGDISIGGSLMLNNSGFSKIYGGTNYGIIYSSIAGDQLHDFRGNVKILGSDSSSLNYALKVDNSSNISLLKISNDGRSIFNYGLSVLGTNFGHTFSGISGYSNIFTIGEEGLSNTYFKIDTGGAFQFGNIASTKIFSFDNSNFSFMTANVGIGTETPSAKLEVYGSANNYARLGSQYSTIRESASAFLQFSFNYNEDFYLYAKGIFLTNPTTNKSINNDNSGVIGASYNYNFSDYSFKSYDLSAVNYFEINHIGYYGQNRLGVNVTPTATIHAKGFDSTSGSYGLKVDNSSSVPLFYIRNDGLISITNSNFATFGIKNIFETDAYNTYLQIEPVVASSNKFYISTIGYGFWNYGSANPNVSPLDGSGLLYKNNGFEVLTYGGSSKFMRFNVTDATSYVQYYAGYSDASFNFQSDIFRVGKGGAYNFLQIDATNAGAGITKMGLGGLGALSNITALLHLKSDDSLSTNFALKVDNSSNTPLLYVSNNGTVTIKAFGGFSADVTLGVAGFTHTYGWKSKGHNRIEYGANDFSTDTRPMIEWNNSIASAVFLTGIKDDDSWGIYTAFDWKFIINKNTGNVGLGGATSPDASLHVRGISSTSSDYALKVDNLSNTPLLYVRNDGSVGVGGTSIYSNYKLQIIISSANDGLQIIGGGVGSALLTTDSDGSSGTLKLYNSALGSNAVVFNNNSNSYIITPYNFGVGISSPTAKLHVQGSTNVGEFVIKMTDGYGTNVMKADVGGSIYFSQSNGPNVNIGDSTLAPTAVLEIQKSSLNNNQFLGFTNTQTGYRYFFGINATTNSFRLYDSTASSDRLILDTVGQFGLGVVPINAKLHVQGIDSLSTNYALKLDNSSSTPLLYVRNDGFTTLGTTLLTSKFSVAAGDVGVELGYGYSIGNFKIFATDSFNANSLLIGNGATGTNAPGEAYIAIGRSANSTELGIAIGAYTSIGASSYDGIAIGRSAITNAGSVRSVSIGRNANSQHNNSWAVGFNSVTTQDNEFNFGALATNTKFIFNGDVGVSTSLPTARLHIKGISSTSADYALKVDNSSNSPLLYVRNDNTVLVNSNSTPSNASLYVRGKTNDITSYSFLSANNSNQTLLGVYNSGEVGVGGFSGQGVLLSVTNTNAMPINFRVVKSDSTIIMQTFDSGSVAMVNTVIGNASATPNAAMLQVIGSDSTSANYALKINNNSSTPLLYVRNDGMVYSAGKGNLYSNTAYGDNSMLSITTGNVNTSFGSQSLKNNTVGSNNSSFGSTSLTNNVSGSYNASFGSFSLQNNNADSNSSFGHGALTNNTTGDENTGLGQSALYTNASGHGNVAVGVRALLNNTIGYRNVSLGWNTMFSNVDGVQNTSIGMMSLYYNTNGSQNVALGDQAGKTNNGNRNVFIGSFSGSNQTIVSDKLIIDNKDRGSASNELINSLIVGTFAGTAAGQILRFNANVGYNGTSFGAGIGVLFKGFAATVPTTNPTGGVIDYVENTGSGVQKYRDTNGTIIAY